MSNDEILRFQKMEKLLENKISRRFKIRRLDKDDFGYLIEHLYGQTGTAYEEYEYHLSKKKLDNETLIKYCLCTATKADLCRKKSNAWQKPATRSHYSS